MSGRKNDWTLLNAMNQEGGGSQASGKPTRRRAPLGSCDESLPKGGWVLPPQLGGGRSGRAWAPPAGAAGPRGRGGPPPGKAGLSRASAALGCFCSLSTKGRPDVFPPRVSGGLGGRDTCVLCAEHGVRGLTSPVGASCHSPSCHSPSLREDLPVAGNTVLWERASVPGETALSPRPP